MGLAVTAASVLCSVLFLLAGSTHFFSPYREWQQKLVPPPLPAALCVSLSGFWEVIGAIALLVPKYRAWAAWTLFGVVVVVTPANIYMFTHDIPYGNHRLSYPWGHATRMTIQALLLVCLSSLAKAAAAEVVGTSSAAVGKKAK